MTRVTGSLQYPCVATAVIHAARVSDWSEVLKLFTIPEDALIINGYVHIITAFDAGTSLTIDVGDDDDADRFTATAPVDMTATGVTQIESGEIGAMYNDTAEVQATFVLAGDAPEVGKAVVYLEYVRPDSAHGVS